jgi:hypothetical protein
MSGLPPSGSISFGEPPVMGRSRLPSPAAGITRFNTTPDVNHKISCRFLAQWPEVLWRIDPGHLARMNSTHSGSSAQKVTDFVMVEARNSFTGMTSISGVL